MKATWITATYVLLLISIVYLADHGQHHTLFSIIRSVPGGDKVGHFLLMGLFSFLLNTSLRCRTLPLSARRILLGSLIVSVLVTLEEMSQILIRSRSFDLRDLLFDYVGIWMFGRVALYISMKPGLKVDGTA